LCCLAGSDADPDLLLASHAQDVYAVPVGDLVVPHAAGAIIVADKRIDSLAAG
jgi:hypothetical protein